MSGQRMSRLRCASRFLARRASGSDVLQVRRNLYIHLDALSRRFNHSCQANAAVHRSNSLIALVDIPKGAEITFDYAVTRVPAFWSPYRRVRCTCKTADCRGQIHDIDSVPDKTLHRHRKASALNDYVREYLHARIGDAVENDTAAAPTLTVQPSAGAGTSADENGFLLKGGRIGALLLHGLGGTPNEMRDVAEGLNAAGITVMCPQLAGHCGSYDDLKESRWTEWLRSAEVGLLRLRAECDFVVVGGLSNGAILSLYLAAEHPNLVDGLALYAPTIWLNGWVVPPHAHLFRLVRHKALADRFDFPDLPPHGIKDPVIRQQIHDAMHSGDSSVAGVPVTPGAAVLEHRRLVKATLARLSSIHQPTLVMHAREDDYAELNNVLHLMRNLAGPVDTVVLDDSYHIITADRQKDVVIARSIEYIERISKHHQQAQHVRPAVAAPALGIQGRQLRPVFTANRNDS
jgi:carboxylesterase